MGKSEKRGEAASSAVRSDSESLTEPTIASEAAPQSTGSKAIRAARRRRSAAATEAAAPAADDVVGGSGGSSGGSTDPSSTNESEKREEAASSAVRSNSDSESEESNSDAAAPAADVGGVGVGTDLSSTEKSTKRIEASSSAVRYNFDSDSEESNSDTESEDSYHPVDVDDSDWDEDEDEDEARAPPKKKRKGKKPQSPPKKKKKGEKKAAAAAKAAAKAEAKGRMKGLHVHSAAYFAERLKHCRAFLREKGHLNVPPNCSSSLSARQGGRETLGEWAEQMRSDFRAFFSDDESHNGFSGNLSETTVGDRLEQLEEIGFVFATGGGEGAGETQAADDSVQEKDADTGRSSRVMWDWRLNLLRQFKADHGHLNILKKSKPLGVFAYRMRSLYRQRLEGETELTDAQKEKMKALEDLEFTFDRSFDKNLFKLKAFKAANGHCKCPLNYPPDKWLGLWVDLIRQDNNRMNRGEEAKYLTTDRLRKLTDIGFVFEGKPPSEQDEPSKTRLCCPIVRQTRPAVTPWEVNFDRLVAYRAEHGRDPPSHDDVLGGWITDQRRNYRRKSDGEKCNPITEERMERLRGVGFVFEPGPRPSAAEALAEGKEMKGLQVKSDAYFAERLEQCRAFRKEKGHLNVPPDAWQGGRETLGVWAERMRSDFRAFFSDDDGGRDRFSGNLLKTTVGDRLEQLEEIGFVFETGRGPGAGGTQDSDDSVQEKGTDTGCASRVMWDWRLNLLRRFKADHGHLHIQNNKNKSLGTFASRMRSLYRQRLESEIELTDAQKEKMKALDDLEFAFDGGFDVKFFKLRAFKAKHGHCKCPLNYPPDRTLGHWIQLVRGENNKLNRGEKSKYLTMDRMRKLTGIGFVFEGKPPATPWEVNFDRLAAYRAEHGRDPPLSHEVLGVWVSEQRRYYRRRLDGKRTKTITDERMEKLLGVGFVFEPGPRHSAETLAKAKEGKKKTFDDRLAEFVRWKEKHGHPYVPTVTDGEDKNLGRWVAAQRVAYSFYQGKIIGKRNRYGTLTAEKALKLANAGFAFDASHIRRTPKDDAIGSPDQILDEFC